MESEVAGSGFIHVKLQVTVPEEEQRGNALSGSQMPTFRLTRPTRRPGPTCRANFDGKLARQQATHVPASDPLLEEERNLCVPLPAFNQRLLLHQRR